MAGEISELMKWYENAHADFEKKGFVDIKNRQTRSGMGFNSPPHPGKVKAPKVKLETKVRELLDLGWSTKAIVESVGCAPSTVSNVRWLMGACRAGKRVPAKRVGPRSLV